MERAWALAWRPLAKDQASLGFDIKLALQATGIVLFKTQICLIQFWWSNYTVLSLNRAQYQKLKIYNLSLLDFIKLGWSQLS